MKEVTNQRELYTLIKQALGGKGARGLNPATNNKLLINLRGYQLEVYVGPLKQPAVGLKANSIYIKGGPNTLNPAQVEAYANAVTSGTRSVDDIRREIAARFARGF
ncbi:hypothetical protein [Archangium lansingense]|uniref:Uncharacterized protein n=2 Tax=Archangium lansingense TaxID=2995310 RepID=A0ABT3ZYN8_9BACT|nr:hypothetical protein [Archangium lansinium]MCY1074510.1 hypothetical protein [Archangium lansinium]